MRIILLTILTMTFSCQSNFGIESPLAVVVKYTSAENKGLIEEARQYIDVKRVYSKHIEDKNVDYEQIWEDQVRFKGSIGQSPKIEDCFNYYAYNIEEKIDKNKATVNFIAKDPKSSIKKIIYTLELKEKKWLIVGIDYFKQ